MRTKHLLHNSTLIQSARNRVSFTYVKLLHCKILHRMYHLRLPQAVIPVKTPVLFPAPSCFISTSRTRERK
ncbi:hypothetical protein QVD17_06733 [Tagetes erecta]|uniref:Uncharacterized protein n=1 Tax=Tagetes erecta TaxID=13708 RepID=A0AAD8LE64_TARER|nr:hypothetical protein QVD17_06733 [Tagetes erecta]